MTMSPSDAFHVAVQHHQAGQLAEAEKLYRGILDTDPNHIESLHYLGVLAHQAGRSDAAIELIGRAITLDGQVSESHYNIALALATLKRYDEAAAHLARTIQLKPDHAQAHVDLGNVLKAQGKLDDAASVYERSLVLAPNSADAHYNLGNVRMEQGRPQAAVAHFQRAIKLRPGHAAAHNNLGLIALAQGRNDEAARSFKQAVAIDPNLPEAVMNLGNALSAQGRLDDAVVQYQKALVSAPHRAVAHNNIGLVLAAQGKSREATVHFDSARQAKPEFIEAYVNLARMFMADGRLDWAIEVLLTAFKIEETTELKTLIVRCLINGPVGPQTAELPALMRRAAAESWGRPPDLAYATAGFVKANPAIAALIERVDKAWPQRLSADALFAEARFAAVCEDPTLRNLLTSMLVCDVALEKLLTMSRFALLQKATGAAEAVDDGALAFACAIARQCFNNEYVWTLTDDERALAQKLRDAVASGLESGRSIPALQLAAVAAYGPLQALGNDAGLIGMRWPEPVDALLTQQLGEPAEEKALRASIPTLTPIDDDVSRRVRAQYEENPYPRWLRAIPALAPKTIDSYLRDFFPLAAFETSSKTSGADILIAGCGTGQQVVETAQLFTRPNILAVDLSLASLGYAARKTKALGLTNIEYAQADILRLGAIARSFDMIMSTGVLHHMADPFAGWRSLLPMLRPGGFMITALYSKRARAPLAEIRAAITGLTGSPEDIRRFRASLLKPSEPLPWQNVSRVADFFTMSMCRDLLFHVQETELELPAIKAFLTDNGLRFLGFIVEPALQQRFRQRFPGDRDLADLDHWHVFEEENSGAFLRMYQFVVQKPHGPPASKPAG